MMLILAIFGGLVLGTILTVILAMFICVFAPSYLDPLLHKYLVIVRHITMVTILVSLFYSIFLTKKYPIFEHIHEFG